MAKVHVHVKVDAEKHVAQVKHHVGNLVAELKKVGHSVTTEVEHVGVDAGEAAGEVAAELLAGAAGQE